MQRLFARHNAKVTSCPKWRMSCPRTIRQAIGRLVESFFRMNVDACSFGVN